MKNQVKALKVKIKSLAAEAGIIRLEERRALTGKRRDEVLYASLRQHRVWDVRREQRSALLAYAFIRGRSYAECERPAEANPPDIERVLSLVRKFGVANPWQPAPVDKAVIAKWLAGKLDAHPFAAPAKPAA